MISTIAIHNRRGSSTVQNRWNDAEIRVDGVLIGSIDSYGDSDMQRFDVGSSFGDHIVTFTTFNILNLAEIEIFGIANCTHSFQNSRVKIIILSTDEYFSFIKTFLM